MTPHFAMGRAAISKHLTILKEAGLVTECKVGRETRNRLNPAPLKELQDWLAFVFYEDGLGVNVLYTVDDPKKRAVGFKI